MTKKPTILANTTLSSLSLAMSQLPPTGFLRLKQITGDPKAVPPIPPIIPISPSGWWAGISEGRYPKPVKLGPRTTAWRVEDILTLIESLTESGER